MKTENQQGNSILKEFKDGMKHHRKIAKELKSIGITDFEIISEVFVDGDNEVRKREKLIANGRPKTR